MPLNALWSIAVAGALSTAAGSLAELPPSGAPSSSLVSTSEPNLVYYVDRDEDLDLSGDFRLENKGNSSVDVISIGSSCQCVEVLTKPPLKIASNQSGTLSFKFKMGPSDFHRKSTIILLFSDKSHLELTVSGLRKAPVSIIGEKIRLVKNAGNYIGLVSFIVDLQRLNLSPEKFKITTTGPSDRFQIGKETVRLVSAGASTFQYELIGPNIIAEQKTIMFNVVDKQSAAVKYSLSAEFDIVNQAQLESQFVTMRHSVESGNYEISLTILDNTSDNSVVVSAAKLRGEELQFLVTKETDLRLKVILVGHLPLEQVGSANKPLIDKHEGKILLSNGDSLGFTAFMLK